MCTLQSHHNFLVPVHKLCTIWLRSLKIIYSVQSWDTQFYLWMWMGHKDRSVTSSCSYSYFMFLTWVLQLWSRGYCICNNTENMIMGIILTFCSFVYNLFGEMKCEYFWRQQKITFLYKVFVLCLHFYRKRQKFFNILIFVQSKSDHCKGVICKYKKNPVKVIFHNEWKYCWIPNP